MKATTRVEHDSLGSKDLPAEALYGVHTARALENFPPSGESVHLYLIKAFLWIKRAAAIANEKAKTLDSERATMIVESADDLLALVERAATGESEEIRDYVVVDPYQGGAGTSLNMNVNEIVANRALRKRGEPLGRYDLLHPLDDVNRGQSTNDVFPTALKIAAILLLRELQEAFAELQGALQKKETEFGGVAKLGRTQLMDAAPITLGQEFGAWAQAFARDRWRLYNIEERLRSINIGGGAVGNAIAVDPTYAFAVAEELRRATGLPLARAEDLVDATANLDVVVETAGIVKAGAVSLAKMSDDVRLLASGPAGGFGELILEARQVGSSIMPGKVNPVIFEHARQIASVVIANDAAIANLVAGSNLELPQFLPAVAHLYLKSLTLLRDAVRNTARLGVPNIRADRARCARNLAESSAVAVAFVPEFGYERVAAVVKRASEEGVPFLRLLKQELNIDDRRVVETLSRELGTDLEDAELRT
jgi:aspartate ammonia-lyase